MTDPLQLQIHTLTGRVYAVQTPADAPIEHLAIKVARAMGFALPPDHVEHPRRVRNAATQEITEHLLSATSTACLRLNSNYNAAMEAWSERQQRWLAFPICPELSLAGVWDACLPAWAPARGHADDGRVLEVRRVEEPGGALTDVDRMAYPMHAALGWDNPRARGLLRRAPHLIDSPARLVSAEVAAAGRLRLIYKGRQLIDLATPSEYDMVDDDHVHVVLRTRGS
jgi:hypothetical protein